MVYPDPSFNGLLGLFGYANSVTEQLFVPMALISMWLIVFLWLLNRQYDAADSATSASFITVFPAVFFRVATYNGVPLLNDYYLLLAVFTLIVSAVWMYFKDK